MLFSVNSTLREILADERAKAILDKHIPGASLHPQIDMGLHMSLREVAMYPEANLNAEKLKALVEDLEQLS